MLRDRTHKRAVGGFFALAILLFAGLAQGADSADGINASLNESSNGSINESLNASVNAVEPSLLESNATSEVQETEAIGSQNATIVVSEMEAVDSQNATIAVAEVDDETAAADVANASAPEAGPGTAGSEIGEALPANHTVCLNGCAFTTIQAAIDVAVDGDLVEVGSGTYSENVVVDKRITLRGVDTGEGLPAVNGRSNGTVVVLKAGGIVLEGLYIVNAGPYPSAGIEVVSSDNIIEGCSVWNSGHWGIYLKGGSTNNTVSNCVASNNGNDGIMVFKAPGNRFRENTIANNGYHGIQILESDNTVVERNVIGNNSNSGVSVETSGNAVVMGNIISYNSIGIQLKGSGIDRIGPNRFIANGQDLATA
jgi:nitrous oxidase accessory protein